MPIGQHDDAGGQLTSPSRWKNLAVAAPFLFALLMAPHEHAKCQLRQCSVYSDAARHAMNGAMIYDFVKIW